MRHPAIPQVCDFLPPNTQVLPAFAIAACRRLGVMFANPPPFYHWPRGGGLVCGSARIHPTAVVETGAVVGPRAYLGENTHVCAEAVVNIEATLQAHALVERRAVVGERVRMGVSAGVGEGARIGLCTQLGARARVAYMASVGIHCQIGDDAFVASESSIGAYVTIHPKVQVGGCIAAGAELNQNVASPSVVAAKARIGAEDWWVSGGPCGSRDAFWTAVWSHADRKLRWWIGCQRGITTARLRARLRDSTPAVRADYEAAIAFVTHHPALRRVRRRK